MTDITGDFMTDETRETIRAIDAFIRQNAWFDFVIDSCDRNKAVIIGSTDFSYYHELEITFHDLFFISGYFSSWKSDTGYPVFTTPNQSDSYLMSFELEVTKGSGDIFIFNIEDSQNKIVIVAKSVSYNTDTVLYYYREDLPPGMRLAPAITKPVQS